MFKHMTFCLLLVLQSICLGQLPQEWQRLSALTDASLRGLDVVDDQTVWISGSGGQFLWTKDGGKTWTRDKIPDADSLDIRDIHAQKGGVVVAMTAGAGEKSRIYWSENFGTTWELVNENHYPKGFYCALDFWPASGSGLVFSDPVEGKFIVLKTRDFGKTWREIDRDAMPEAIEGEYAFAASGTCITTWGTRHAWIGTGGTVARVFRTTDGGNSWSVSETPMLQGEASTGIFSLVFSDPMNGIAVGGDYRNPEKVEKNLIVTSDGGDTWRLKEAPGVAYRSVVRYYFQGSTLTHLLVGRSGSNLHRKGSSDWPVLGNGAFYTADIAPSGRIAWAAGADGRIGKLLLTPTTTEN